MENNLFQKAKEAITNLTNARENTNESDRQIAQKIIQDAYNDASPEERQQLEEFEQQLKQNNQIL